MSGANRDAHEASAPGVLLVVASSAALHETAAFGGSVFLHELIEQLLRHLGTCSIDTETKPSGSSSPDGIISWRCQMDNKYYTAKLRAVLVQQQEAAQGCKNELLFHESPEAVVFICSQQEQQQLHDARRALTKTFSQEDGEPEGHIEPLPFMKEIYFDRGKRVQGEDHSDRRVQTASSASSSWWVRDVPLKFLISLHCNQGIHQRNCSSNSGSDPDDEVETQVWNIGGDLFFEGMELCFNAQPTPRTADTFEPTKASIASMIAQQNHRLKKVAEGLQCHIWPGLSRRGGGRGKGSSEEKPPYGSSESSCSTSEGTSQCIPLVNSNSAKDEGGHKDSRKSNDTLCEEKSAKNISALKQDEPLGSAKDVEAFDALAAAMLDLKQRGSSVASADRRRTAMRLAAQLASLTMCDEN
ncbi:hypothetical protein Emag_003675 [Eimeria magna]